MQLVIFYRGLTDTLMTFYDWHLSWLSQQLNVKVGQYLIMVLMKMNIRSLSNDRDLQKAGTVNHTRISSFHSFTPTFLHDLADEDLGDAGHGDDGVLGD